MRRYESCRRGKSDLRAWPTLAESRLTCTADSLLVAYFGSDVSLVHIRVAAVLSWTAHVYEQRLLSSGSLHSSVFEEPYEATAGVGVGCNALRREWL